MTTTYTTTTVQKLPHEQVKLSDLRIGDIFLFSGVLTTGTRHKVRGVIKNEADLSLLQYRVHGVYEVDTTRPVRRIARYV